MCFPSSLGPIAHRSHPPRLHLYGATAVHLDIKTPSPSTPRSCQGRRHIESPSSPFECRCGTVADPTRCNSRGYDSRVALQTPWGPPSSFPPSWSDHAGPYDPATIMAISSSLGTAFSTRLRLLRRWLSRYLVAGCISQARAYSRTSFTGLLRQRV